MINLRSENMPIILVLHGKRRKELERGYDEAGRGTLG